MNKLRTSSRYFIYAVLAAVLLSSCDTEPRHRVWYGNNGMRVESKSTNDMEYGKWKYVAFDNYGKILIRTNEDWNVGDTLLISVQHSR